MNNQHNDELVSEVLQHSQDAPVELQEAITKLISNYNLHLDTLQKQGRLATIGEMMDSVAHQWKQPLNALSMMMELVKIDFVNSSIDEQYIENLEKDVYRQISHMTNTLNEFRNFLRPTTKLSSIYVHTLFSKVLLLMKDELISQNINIHVEIDHETMIYGNPNELKHLFINIINNSIDIFNEKESIKRDIYFRCSNDRNTMIEIEDNAGGIPEEIIADIFKPNFTTKKEGTGIGLYMCSKIVKKHYGTIIASNTEKGAIFSIGIPKKSHFDSLETSL